MDVWRICKSEHASQAFDGIGAQKTGGRWNHKGHPIVYASENLSLAALELFVHVPPAMTPNDLVAIRGSLPSSVSAELVRISDLPADWRRYPAPAILKTIGTDWLARRSSLVLRVPSAINPQEENVLLNPTHAEIKKLIVKDVQPFHFDPRMFGK